MILGIGFRVRVRVMLGLGLGFRVMVRVSLGLVLVRFGSPSSSCHNTRTTIWNQNAYDTQ